MSISLNPMLIDADNFEKDILDRGLSFMDNIGGKYWRDISPELEQLMKENILRNITSRMDIYDRKGGLINMAADSFMYFIAKRYEGVFPRIELLEKLSLKNDIKEPGCEFSGYLNNSETLEALNIINEIIKIETKYVIELEIVKKWFSEAIENKMGVIYFFV
jgi:hypothetical protein